MITKIRTGRTRRVSLGKSVKATADCIMSTPGRVVDEAGFSARKVQTAEEIGRPL